MRFLVLDTSCRVGVAGLCDGEKTLAEVHWQSEEGHSARLLKVLETLFETVNLDVSWVDGVGVTTGPGSFTGLRVGLATLKGLFWKDPPPTAGISSLEALAASYPLAGGILCPALDARKGRVFSAVYRKAGEDLEILLPPGDLSISEVLAAVPPIEIPVFFGEGARRFAEEILRRRPDAQIPAPSFDHPRAGALARLAERSLRRGEALDLKGVEPVYLRASEAEIASPPANL